MKVVIPIHTSGYFATVEDDKADIRGWQFQFIEDGKIYFCTSNKKDVYQQLQKNPNCAFSCNAGGYAFRIRGKAIMVTDKEVISNIHASIDKNVAEVYPTPEDNGFAVFYLENGEVKYSRNFVSFERFTF
ncbi:MAG: pyridoxamine 5'-phosphate oxidase [Clostridium butyricum]|nr:pyridoxamine 5'-phosphate oxidase [Clostridium butyricum]